MSVSDPAASSLPHWLHAKDGPLTRELVLEPGRFGLGRVPEKRSADSVVDMICGYCSTGCSLRMHLRNGEAVSLSPTPGYPVNLGSACPKGWEALSALDGPGRGIMPLLRDCGETFRGVSWNEALSEFVTRFKSIQSKHGNESIAFLSTGQMPTEEMAYLGALAKFGMGMKHGDGNTRQCMATSVVAYKQAFGFDAPPYTYADFEESDTIVLVGSNLCIAHPILWERVMRNPHRPEIIVLDPRRTETAMQSTLHLPLAPKSDQALLYAVAHELIARGAIDRNFVAAHTSGFDEFAAFVEDFPLDRAAVETRLPLEQIERLIELIARGERVSFWWTMGVNQSHQGVRTAQAIINLALLTGNIGRPGTGANSITGQCNAMGSRLFSNTTNLLGGHDFANAEQRDKVARILGIDAGRIPHEPGMAYHEIMEGILKGTIRGLWVVCTNTAHSWINQDYARDVLTRLDFLVVQDLYPDTETARMAHLYLPAAGWGEKEGTFINSERRIGVLHKVRRAPGEALADFQIFRLVADAWGCGDLLVRWNSPADVFEDLKRLSAGQPCDFSGIENYASLDAAGGVQWPCVESPAGLTPERRLFADGRFHHPDGRARFCFESPRPLPEPLSEKFPLLLLTGRGSAVQWHTQTRTGRSAVLKKLAPEELFLELNPHDARRLSIRANELVAVASQRGSIVARALITPTVQPGQIFLPMHFEATNRLTDAVFDPYSKQPAYKACAVSVRRL